MIVPFDRLDDLPVMDSKICSREQINAIALRLRYA